MTVLKLANKSSNAYECPVYYIAKATVLTFFFRIFILQVPKFWAIWKFIVFSFNLRYYLLWNLYPSLKVLDFLCQVIFTAIILVAKIVGI